MSRAAGEKNSGVENLSKDFSWPIRVYYEDTDVGGVVYYANYLKFMERARTEWLRALGFEQDRLMSEAGLIFVVAGVEVRYRRPARFNDRLTVTVGIEEIGRSTVVFRQAVAREGAESEILCDGIVRAACVDVDSLRPRSLPPELLAELDR